MLEEQQAIVPNFTSPNPNVIPQSLHPVVPSSSIPHLHGLHPQSAFQLHSAVASGSGILSQTTDSTTYQHAGGTLGKATKVSMFLQCEVCNIACNSEDALENHKQGKKHIKNLQKVAITSFIAPKMPQPPIASAPVAGELENKTQKLLQNGASADTLMYCGVCNVVCNSQDSFGKHVAGKRHIAKVGNANGSSVCPEAQPSSGGLQKKPDTLEGVRCEVCNISCTSNEALNTHFSGKKHQKKAAAVKEEGKVDGSKRKAGGDEDLERKKQKVIGGAAALEGLRTCSVCSVVCNSPTVFISHLAGQKHAAAMAAKHAEEAGATAQ